MEKVLEDIDTKRLARQIERRREICNCCLINGHFAAIDTAQCITARITSPSERITIEHLKTIQEAILTWEVQGCEKSILRDR